MLFIRIIELHYNHKLVTSTAALHLPLEFSLTYVCLAAGRWWGSSGKKENTEQDKVRTDRADEREPLGHGRRVGDYDP